MDLKSVCMMEEYMYRSSLLPSNIFGTLLDEFGTTDVRMPRFRCDGTDSINNIINNNNCHSPSDEGPESSDLLDGMDHFPLLSSNYV